jgi:uncharacterized protein
MSKSKYKLKNLDEVFYYENETHSVYDSTGQILTLPALEHEDYYVEESKKHGVLHKDSDPQTLRILLGHACNYSCGYCMQKDIGNPFERSESYHLEPFIESIHKNLDLSKVETVELWGGEPFLYWKDMTRIMNFLDREGIKFFISTNGSPLSQKHVDFFKTLKATVAMAVSHDGPGQESLRGDDILKNPKKVEILRQLHNMEGKVGISYNTVISSTNYDLFEINDYFRDYALQNDLGNKVKLFFIAGKNYDDTDKQGNSASHILRGDALKDFNRIFKNYLDQYLQDLGKDYSDRRLLKNGLVEGTAGVLNYAVKLRNAVPITVKSNCGADSSDVLSMDIQGRVRVCPHTHEKFVSGHINDIKGIKIIGLDISRKTTHCYHCPVKRMCKSSCPIEFPDQVFLSNCAIEKVWYGNIQKAAFKMLFRDEVEFLDENVTIPNEIRPIEDTSTQV